jgi:hypothetical protein
MRLLFRRLFLNVCCLLSSCLHQSFEFCSPFLICGVRRFENERDFIPFGRMVVFLICLRWNVLLGLLLWWHRELYFGWNTVGANVGGIRKSGQDPRTQEKNVCNIQVRVADDVRGDKGSLHDCSCLQSCESFYTYPRAPFYRETKGLLHSNNTLEPK